MKNCCDCGAPCNGERCRACYDLSRPYRMRKLVCPDCGTGRLVNHQTYWAAMQRETPGRCLECGRRSVRMEAETRSVAQVARGSKWCRGCRADRPLADFSRASRHVDGLATYCKTCDAGQMRDWYAANKERAKETAREWARRNPLRRRSIAHNWYGRSRDPHAEHVDHRALLDAYGWVCHICTETIESVDDLAFDHVVPFARGGRHVQGNVRPAHYVCNARKGDR